MSDSKTQWAEQSLAPQWDLTTQTPHGGQDWNSLENFVEDFSVTTNFLGTPAKALQKAVESMKTVSHYPSSNFEPAWSNLAQFYVAELRVDQAPSGDKKGCPAELYLIDHQPENYVTADTTNGYDTLPPSRASVQSLKHRLLLGNGASELIDLCVRTGPGDTWRPGPTAVQYMEYERSATSMGKKKLDSLDKSASLLSMVNPCNPTGDFLDIISIKEYIEEQCQPNSVVIIDESMLPWYGPDWRSQSVALQEEWLAKMAVDVKIDIYVIASWTKIWACPGLRLGSVVAPTVAKAKLLRMMQVPWSLNTMAIAFLAHVVYDTEYLNKTWELTPKWRKATEVELKRLHPEWDIKGVGFQPFLWVDTKSRMTAEECVNRCKEMGVPIRWGFCGYNMPTHIRIAVRDSKERKVLFEALSK